MYISLFTFFTFFFFFKYKTTARLFPVIWAFLALLVVGFAFLEVPFYKWQKKHGHYTVSPDKGPVGYEIPLTSVSANA